MERYADAIGLTHEQLRLLIGDPTDVSAKTKQGQPVIFKYDAIEYHFGLDNRVFLVYSEDDEGNPAVHARDE